MDVFISWSKQTSKDFALLLKQWLPEVIQQIEPWISTEDIDKGQRWAAEIGAKLGELHQGILCITAENVDEPWLLFEAGALAKSMDDARVRPVLLGLQPSDIKGLLAQFEATIATDGPDMRKLISSLNAVCPRPLEPDRLNRAFELTWADYMTRLHAVTSASVETQAPPRRSGEDMLGEVLERVREVQRTLDGRRDRTYSDPMYIVDSSTGRLRQATASERVDVAMAEHIAKSPECAGASVVERQTILTASIYFACDNCGNKI